MTRSFHTLLLCCIGLLGSIMSIAQPNINRIEYYIDNDPGFGKATNISFSGTKDISTSVIINTSPLSAGVHIVGLRSRDANGRWSMDNKWIFLKPYESTNNSTATSIINRVEYYVDTDPGFGNATNVPIAASQDISNVSFNVNFSNLYEGVHIIGVRSRDANNLWSYDNKWLFVKPYNNTTTTISKKINAIEYYFDNDPGLGLGTPVSLNAASTISNLSVFANITRLGTGSHKLYFRSKDDQGSWSLDNVFNITLASSSTTPSIIVNSINNNVLCAGDSIKIAYDITGTYNAGNQFKVQLSNASGSFTTPTEIGSVYSTSENIIAAKLPSNVTSDGTGYKIRIVSTNPIITGANYLQSLTIRNRPGNQTITGQNNVNTTTSWPYSVPTISNTTWNWMITGGLQTSGTTTNSITAQFAQTTNALTTGFVKTVQVNQYGCVGDTSSISVNIYKLKIENTPASNTICRGGNLSVNVSADGVFDAGNIYTAQLSDALGSFNSPTNIGSLTQTGIGINQTFVINTTIPLSIPDGSGYRIRVISSSPSFSGISNSFNISINNPEAPIATATQPTCSISTGAININSPIGTGYTYSIGGAFQSSTTFSNVNSGTYYLTTKNANGCLSNATPIVINQQSNVVINATQTITSCGSYLWNGILYNQSGTFSYTTKNADGCDSMTTLYLAVINCNASIVLNLKMYLEGFLTNNNTNLITTLYDLGLSQDPTSVDSIEVKLWSAANINNSNPDYAKKGILHSNGTISIQFPSTTIGNWYFISVNHRNSIETWSSTPILISNTTVYDFTNNLNKAYSDGINPAMKNVENGKFAFYGGDINQDGTVDGSDMNDIDNNTSIAAFGYDVTDINGDGASDGLDMNIVDNNTQSGLFFARPSVFPPTPNSLPTDIDGNVYPTVVIGNQTWFSKNLNVSRYRNGDIIPEAKDSADWVNQIGGVWCWVKYDSATYSSYGKLYNWYAVNDPRGLAPTGWHVSDEIDWNKLTIALDPLSDTNCILCQPSLKAGRYIRSNIGWPGVTIDSFTNISGFNALPAGYRIITGELWTSYVGSFAYWWTTKEYTANGGAFGRTIHNNFDYLGKNVWNKKNGYSVRCVKN